MIKRTEITSHQLRSGIHGLIGMCAIDCNEENREHHRWGLCSSLYPVSTAPALCSCSGARRRRWLFARQRRTGDPDLLHLRKGHYTNNARERINSAMTQHCSNCSRNTVATFLVIDLNFKFLINRWISLLMLIHCRSFILNPSMQRRIPIQHVGGGEHALRNN